MEAEQGQSKHTHLKKRTTLLNASKKFVVFKYSY